MSLFDTKKILICLGTGGVGKTTIAASLAVRASQLGKNVLVLTIDPSKRLASALGLENWAGDIRLVPELSSEGQLYAGMIEAKSVFDSFVMETGASKDEIQGILQNAFYRELSTSLSGTQEFTSLQALYKAVRDPRFDLVILDTPPVQHTVEFLESPKKIYRLFTGSVVDWFSSISEPKGFFFGLINKSTLMAFQMFEKITGSQFLREIETFFKLISKFRNHVNQISTEVLDILSYDTTGFVMIGRFDSHKLEEAEGVIKSLEGYGHPISAMILNGMLPQIDPSKITDSAWKNLLTDIQQYTQYQSEQYHVFKTRVKNEFQVKVLPYMTHERDETAVLRKIAREFENDF